MAFTFIVFVGGFISGLALICLINLVRYFQARRDNEDDEGVITYDRITGKEIASCFDLLFNPLEKP